MPILVATGLSKAYGPRVLLDNVDLSVHAGERVGVVGINGSGKSTLCKILAGIESADAGEVIRRRDATIEYLAQEPELPAERTAREVVRDGLREWSAAFEAHAAASEALGHPDADFDALLEAQAKAGAEVERLGGWDRGHLVDAMLGHLKVLEPDAPVGRMSGGERRRVALARLLVSQPSLAILDEPTNHLDVDTIEWLERYLSESYGGALVLITHDRYVLDRDVTRTLEVEGGQVHSYDGAWEEYLMAKAERQAHEARAERNRQNFLRTELEWLRRSPKARTTKSQSRVDRAEAARDQAAPTQQRTAGFTLETTRLGKTIVDLRDVSVTLGDRPLIRDLTFMLTSGMRLGVVGPNGAGKSTLLRLLVGELTPDRGEVIIGKNTELGYFDQGRSGLDDTADLMVNVAGHDDKVTFRGERIDVRTYLARFLFAPDRMRQKVVALSGGERARVALAKLLLKPSNVLLLDEPTNDLDVATLSSLEQMLIESDATAIVVSHDRYFLDRVATHILAFEGDGRLVAYAGNYELYRTLSAAAQAEREAAEKALGKAASKNAPMDASAPKDGAGVDAGRDAKNDRPAKLSQKERRELDGMLEAVDAAEQALAALDAQLADPSLYAERPNEVRTITEKQQAASAKVEQLMARWDELEQRRAAAEG
ncbi:MAG: ABC-F family ATP-binding cassette domain-containing protein [Sandaracinaceae bacterium]|nr:ABC-F family ATP-binding cassette domain-containing protein [Sandaracinaceae bacterium]